MQSVDRLNKYPPGTYGFVLLGERWKRYWEPGIILGRVNGHRRVKTFDGKSWFIEHEQQFQLTRPWYGYKLVHLGRI